MRPVFPFVLLDLDGTLTDSAPGILNAIEYALRHFHIDVPRSELNFMIGPPITEGFTRLLGGDRALAVKCVPWNASIITTAAFSSPASFRAYTICSGG